MNKVVVGVAVLAVVAGGGVAVAGFTGGKVADELHAETAKVLQLLPAVKVVEHKVSKGLTSSTHEVTVEVGCATVPGPDAEPGATPSGPMQFTWRDRISHGPLPGLRSVGLAVIDSELVLPPKVAAEVAKLMGDKPLFTARTTVGFGTDYVSVFNSPAFKFAEEGKGNLDWQGMNLTLRGNLRKGAAAGATYNFDAPGLLVNVTEGKPVQIKVGAITMKGEILPRADAGLWLGPNKGTASIAAIEVTAPRPGADADAKPVSMVFDGLQLEGESTLDQGLLSSVSRASGKGRIDDFAIDKLEMQVSMRRIHAATYQKLVSQMMTASMSCDKPGKEALQAATEAAMAKGLVALLPFNPEYSLDKLAVEVGGKRAELGYAFSVKGVTEADAETPLQALFVSKGLVTANASVQMGFIETIIKKVVAMQGGPAVEGADKAAETLSAQTQMVAMANMMIDQAADKGMVVREGDLVKASAKFEGGQLLVNDKPMGMPMLGGK